MNPNQVMYFENGMMNFNYFHSFMGGDMTNMIYMKILQDNIALRNELQRRDYEEKEKLMCQSQTEPSQEPSLTKVQELSREQKYQQEESEMYSSSQISKQNRRKPTKAPKKTPRNETKNIPKNFGKAIINFVQQNKELTRRILSNFPQVKFSDFITYLRLRRRKINSISDLREFWTGETNPYIKPIRILSNLFLRKYSLEYVFNSRISNFGGHIKYRTRLLEALENPESFVNIKHY